MSGRISAYEAGGERWEDLSEDDVPESRAAHRARPRDLRVEPLLEAERFVVVLKPAMLRVVVGR